MTKTQPTRIDIDLLQAAAAAGEVASRSATQQVQHWARLGRALESSQLPLRSIQRVLAGEASYDDLVEPAQSVVRTVWDDRVRERLESLDLAAEFRARGHQWVEADADGNPIICS